MDELKENLIKKVFSKINDKLEDSYFKHKWGDNFSKANAHRRDIKRVQDARRKGLITKNDHLIHR